MNNEQLAKNMRRLSTQMELMAGAMLDSSDGEDELHQHGQELMGAAKSLISWAEGIDE